MTDISHLIGIAGLRPTNKPPCGLFSRHDYGVSEKIRNKGSRKNFEKSFGIGRRIAKGPPGMRKEFFLFLRKRLLQQKSILCSRSQTGLPDGGVEAAGCRREEKVMSLNREMAEEIFRKLRSVQPAPFQLTNHRGIILASEDKGQVGKRDGRAAACCMRPFNEAASYALDAGCSTVILSLIHI